MTRLVIAVVLLTMATLTVGQDFVGDTLFDCSTSCCDEDCCGPGTRWVDFSCIEDSDSPGWTGTYSSEYTPGCALRSCCESNCCSSGDGAAGTVFNLPLGYCVPATEAPTSSPTITTNPTGTPFPTTSPTETDACDPSANATETILDTDKAFDSDYSEPPATWKRIPGTVPIKPRDIEWLYDWVQDGVKDVVNPKSKNTFESEILKESNRIINFPSVKAICKKCAKENSILKKALCAAAEVHRQKTLCRQVEFLLAVLKCLGIQPAVPKVRAKRNKIHSWVEFHFNGKVYALDPVNQIYVEIGPIP